MEIILLERIERLGQMGDVVNVKNGYARNFLFPQHKALRKTADNLKLFEAKRKEYEAINAKLKAEAEEMAKKMANLSSLWERFLGSNKTDGPSSTALILVVR